MSDDRKYLIGEFSNKTGVSVRTLHYYDEKGLLKPEKHPSSGHRIYSDSDIMTLHKIMTLKFLGYSLDAINEMIHESSFDIRLIVKRLVGSPVGDEEVQQLLQKLFSIILEIFGKEEVHEVIDIFQGVESVEDLDEEALTVYANEIEKLVPTPLTEEEEEWLDRAMDYYFENDEKD